jgi:hypothetical protein
MIKILKYTYLLDNKSLAREIEWLWQKYLKILDRKQPLWPELNEARAILYLLGYYFPEVIAAESLKKRVKYINPKISLDRFLAAIDRNEKKILSRYSRNSRYKKLRDFYLITKSIKNRVRHDGSYLEEKTFNRLYRNAKPKNYF